MSDKVEITKEDLERCVAAVYPATGPHSANKIWQALQKPADTFREGEVIADCRFTRTYIKFHQEVADKESYRHLLHSEQGQHVHDLVDAVEAIVEVYDEANVTYRNWEALRTALEAYYAKAGK